MTKSAIAIKYNFSAGTFHDTTLVDGFGLQLMKLSAKLTSPLEYTGLSIAQRLLRAVLPSDRNVEAELLPDTKFLFPYGDAYWAILLDNSSTYSPEMEKFLIALKDVDYSFIDCGANYGYMSAIMTSETFGKKPIIAIEADPGTHKILLSNAEVNQQRFETLNSNGSIALMTRLAKFANLPWDCILGAEIARNYKPHRDAYLHSVAALGLEPQEVVMVAAHNDDLAAAQIYGLRTAFICRNTEHGKNQTEDLVPTGDWDYIIDSFE